MSIDYKAFLNDITDIVVKEGASDLHISEGRNPVIRVSGFLVPLMKLPILTQEDMHGILDNIMSPENKQVFLKDKEIDFSYTHEKSRFRGNGFFQQGKIALALRLIPHSIKTLKE